MTDLETKIAEFLKDRDEALTPDEADDMEREASAQVIAEMMLTPRGLPHCPGCSKPLTVFGDGFAACDSGCEMVFEKKDFVYKAFQDRLAVIHDRLFDGDPTDIEERRARFFEEAIETVQAFGMSTDDMIKLVHYSGNRPVGEKKQEVGGAFVTLTSLCIIDGIDAMECAEADLEKLGRPETIERIRKKRSTRHGRGPLPGLDPGGIKHHPLCSIHKGGSCDFDCARDFPQGSAREE